MMPARLPPFIAVCGDPHSGKTEVQHILQQDYGVIAIDSARIIRDTAKLLYGLTESDVSTQTGKAIMTKVGDRFYTVRELIGRVGCFLEAQHGEHAVIELTLRTLSDFHRRHLECGGSLSFSVRMRQAALLRDAGGVCLGVRSSRGIPSHLASDHYEVSLIDHWIEHDGIDRDYLRQAVAGIMQVFDYANILVRLRAS